MYVFIFQFHNKHKQNEFNTREKDCKGQIPFSRYIYISFFKTVENLVGQNPN